jgi:high-affinity nickel-transport protein
VLIGANVATWIWAAAAFGHHPALLGSALLAWVFGLRHAVDADHIAAIDAVVRKLMLDGQRPVAAGLWFSLGHSTVVGLACLLIAFAASTLDLGGIQGMAGTAGTLVSAGFLLVLAGINLAILRDVWRSLRSVGAGQTRSAEQAIAAAGGLMSRTLRPLLGSVRRSRHMYPVGFLFGLGFDTATEVGLLALAGIQAAQGLSPWEVMVFPALFTAGMALVDTADSVLMVGVYGWAAVQPARRLRYNLSVTAASVAVTILIGSLEVLGLLVDRFNLDGGIWTVVTWLNDRQTSLGLAVIGVFAAVWLGAAILLRWVAPVQPIAD